MAEFIKGHTPRVPADEWSVYGPFTDAIMTDLRLVSVRKAKNLYTALVRFVRWCWRDCGMPLDRDAMFDPAVISNFIAAGCDDLKESTRASYRSCLRQIGGELGVKKFAGMAPEAISLEHNATRPYTAAEIDALTVWAHHQTNSYRRVNATLIVALGLGAGLSTSEIIALTASDVLIDDDDGVLVNVKGPRARQVPLLAQWEAPVATVARAAIRKDLHLVFPQRRVAANPNLISTFVTTVGAPRVPVNPQRMRATWIVGHLTAHVPGDVLAAAAGLGSLDALSRFLRWVPATAEAEARRMLRAQASDATTGGDSA